MAQQNSEGNVSGGAPLEKDFSNGTLSQSTLHKFRCTNHTYRLPPRQQPRCRRCVEEDSNDGQLVHFSRAIREDLPLPSEQSCWRAPKDRWQPNAFVGPRLQTVWHLLTANSALIGFLLSLTPLSMDLMQFRGVPPTGAAGIGVYVAFGGILMILGAIGEVCHTMNWDIPATQLTLL